MSNDMKAKFAARKRDSRYGAPDAAWVKDTRAALLSDISSQLAKTPTNTRPSWTASFSYLLPQSMLASVRSFAVLVLVMGLAVGGWLTSVSASTNSLPGDLLYGVKLASEKTQITVARVTGNKQSAVTLSLKSASNRASEIKQIAKKKPSEVQKATESLEKNLQDAAHNVQDVKETNVSHAAALAKEITLTTAIISGDLNEAVKDIGLKGEGNEKASKEIIETSKAVEGVEIDAIGVVVEGNPNEAKELIAKKTETLLGENQKAQEELEQLEKSLAEKKLAAEEESNSTSTVDVVALNASTSTEEVVVSTTTIENNTVDIGHLQETSKIVKDQTNQIEAGVKETLLLTEGQQLQEAVEKLKQLGDIKEETKEAIGELKLQLDIQQKVVSEPIIKATTTQRVTVPAPVVKVPEVVEKTVSQ